MGSASSGRWYDGAVYSSVVDRLLTGLHDHVATHLPDGQRVLDAACGTGALSQQMARTGRQVVGVDMSQRHIDHARRRVADAGVGRDAMRFEVGDLRKVEAPAEGAWDVAVIVLALHEMRTDVASSVVARLHEVAAQVMIADFFAPLPWNLPGVTNRAAELAAGPSHWAAFRAYQANGGLDALLAGTGATTLTDRTIGQGTIRVTTSRSKTSEW